MNTVIVTSTEDIIMEKNRMPNWNKSITIT